MSEHIVRPRNPGHKVVVGFNPVLQTFFVKVTDRKTGEHVARLGTYEREIIDVIDLYKRVHRYGYLNAEIKNALKADRDAGRAAS